MTVNRRSALAAGASAAALAAVGGVAEAAEPAVADQAAERRLSDEALVASLPGFRNGYAEVNGTRLHYVAGGQGDPLILLPGWPQTWWQFRKIMPALAQRYRVITVELRGMGGSAKPKSGYDKKTMARDTFELVRQLGYDSVHIAGHDIGAMVAFSFAVNHATVTRKVSLLDVPHPDESLQRLTLLPRPDQFYLWWFAFNQVAALPERLLAGRTRFLVDYLCDYMLTNQDAIDEHAREVYARAYSYPDAIRAGNGWYQTFLQDIADQKTYSKVTAPLLAVASPSNFDYVRSVVAPKATDAQFVKLSDTGHYVAEEQPAAVVRALTEFFG